MTEKNDVKKALIDAIKLAECCPKTGDIAIDAVMPFEDFKREFQKLRGLDALDVIGKLWEKQAVVSATHDSIHPIHAFLDEREIVE